MPVINPSTAGGSTTLTQELLVMGTTGAFFFAPNSLTPIGGQALAIIDRATDPYQGVVLYPASISGASTSPQIKVTTAPGVFATVYYNGQLFSDLVTNGANYLFAAGNVAGQTPGVQAFGTDTDVGIQFLPKGAGVVLFNYASIAPGGGAAATLGTIGGSGPNVAAQAKWLKVQVGSTSYYFIPLWST